MELLKRTGAERTACRALQALALLAAFACAASAVPWGAARGSTSYKHLVLPSTARSAALAGGGVSWTGNGLGPVQPASSPRGPLRLSFDRAWMPEEVGARLDRIALERGVGRNGFSLAATILDYDDIDGYTDDDAPAGSYGAGAWHVSFGWSRALGAAEWGMRLSGGRYAIEVKTSANFKGEKSYEQCAKYLDSLGLSEGWMPIFEKSKEKPWDEKIYNRDETVDGKTIHVVGL